MTGVTFGMYHSYNDWGLLLAQKSIGVPSVKMASVDVPGADGLIDLTEVVAGRPIYGNRKLSFTFITTDSLSGTSWSELLTAMSTAIHGKRLEIVLDDDPDWKYTGRITIDSFGTDRAKRTIVVNCDCPPYKLYKSILSTDVVVDGTQTLMIDNIGMAVSPAFFTEASGMTVSCNGSAALSIFPGLDFNIPEILLLPGSNQLVFKGGRDR